MRSLNIIRFAWGILRKHPFNVYIQVTNRCNMKCSFCGFWPHGAKPEEELSLAECQKISKDLAQFGCFLVSLEGGEPLIRPDIVEIVRAFSRYHLTVLYTNGWFVTQELAHALFDAGLHQVGISIDYPDSARHDAKRSWPGAFDKAWNSVDILRNAAPDGGKQIHIMTVLMKENQHDLEELLRTSARHKVNHFITLVAVHGWRRGKFLDAFPVAPVSPHLLDLWQKYPHFRCFRDYLQNADAFLHNTKLPVCRAGHQTFNIDHKANVSPCIEKIDRVVGNLREEPLSVILPRLRALPETRDCQECWTLCRGMSQMLSDGGSWQSWKDLLAKM